MRLASFAFLFCLCFSSAQATEVGLGVVYKDTDAAVDLSYTNNGSTPVVISTVESSCGCLKLIAPPGKINPGETVRIPFNYRSAVAGRVALSVQIPGQPAGQVLATYSINGFVVEQGWLVSPSELKGVESVVYIDTRSKERFADVHIPRSLNLPTFVLKGRTDLKARRVVLVDAGFAPHELLDTVSQLRAQGFSQVSVLWGGLAAWLRQGGAYEGTASEPRLAVASISPADYALARRSGSWSEVETGDLSRNHADVKGDWAHIRKITSRPPAMGRLQENLLVVSPTTSSYARVEAEIKSDKTLLFYLTGGPVALETYRAQQSSLAGKTDQRFQIRQIQGHSPMTGGSKSCGTCGSR